MSLTANAAVVVNLDGNAVSELSAIRYHASYGVLELVLIDNLACQGESSIEPLEGLGLGVSGQIYQLSGPIIMDFSTEAVTLTINSDAGNLDCSSDRIFSDRLIKG